LCFQIQILAFSNLKFFNLNFIIFLIFFDFISFFKQFFIFSLIHLILVPLVLIASYLDHKQTLKIPQVIACFSLKRNFEELMSEKNSIACINGIKAISIFVIMFYHSLQFRLLFPFGDGAQLKSWIDGSFMKLVGPLTIPVDAFLLVSGALATKCIVRDLER
jgi:hypothetical protein